MKDAPIPVEVAREVRLRNSHARKHMGHYIVEWRGSIAARFERNSENGDSEQRFLRPLFAACGCA